MGWMQRLCEAYDCCINADQSSEPYPLIPVGFARKEIKYHVVLTADGDFASADELAAKTYHMIPSTPQAESRTGSNGLPFPLAEQLKYLVCKDGLSTLYKNYMDQLAAWCARDGAPEQLRILKNYLEKRTLLKDMKERALLNVKYDVENGKGTDAKAFVTFSVESMDMLGDELCSRCDVRDSWCDCIIENLSPELRLCYVEGKSLPVSETHAKVQGNAKLISSKDSEYPFQYKGRFDADRSAATVSYTASARAHSALDFLVNRQGLRRFGLTMVAWNTNGCTVHVPVSDKFNWKGDAPEKKKPDTFKVYAELLAKAADGYRQKLEQHDKRKRANQIVILCMEAATDGRMSITYYQDIPGNRYVDRLEYWYKSCCWTMYSPQEKAYCVTTPTVRQISQAVMGADAVKTAEEDKKCSKAVTKQVRELQQCLLKCIVSGSEQPASSKKAALDEEAKYIVRRAALPIDLVKSAFKRAVSPLGFTSGMDNKWSESGWRSALAVACALIRKRQFDENSKTRLDPELNVSCTDRSYLWGRILAVADIAEMRAIEEEKSYQSNAIRMMQRMSLRPVDTWRQLHIKLLPYLRRLGASTDSSKSSAADYLELFGQIEQSFTHEDRVLEAPLSFEFLQGYYSQRQALYGKTATARKDEAYSLPDTASELYGCLLAVADIAELEATEWEHCGATNALRLSPNFDRSPVECWARIHDKLIPYLEKLNVKAGRYHELFRCIEHRFQCEERLSASPLNGSYLHGYYCMRQALIEGRVNLESPERTLRFNESVKSRSEAFGYMLGIENLMERRVLDMEKDDKNYRPSNAMRLMTRTAHTPAQGWDYLERKLEPYRKKLRSLSIPYMEKLKQLEELRKAQGWNTNKPLDGSYLHFFYLI